MTDRTRPTWLAYPLTALGAGIGHCYLGEWKRGAMWFALYVLALGFLSARTLTGAFEPGQPFVVSALQLESVNYVDVAVPLAVLLVCLLDVYLIGLTERTATAAARPDDPHRNGS
ncbi:hypothetical protein EA462_00545 [Natrarchaeobius halalkaliphilus]|uniref:Uncharacterized protein n=1 Tax=Natrarchaeobius halalkaliphilus TaxID=1679091 RepID=A0A3N6P983_9EURY|nr:hypothetical protein [Natrarchaeobius halalkaliphilus]RQG92755.1 hypothetical protein EA462_00545 [Natrarchaeobius halalkaliphilus]